MTKENMPVTSQDIEKVQFPEKISDISVLQLQQQSAWLQLNQNEIKSKIEICHKSESNTEYLFINILIYKKLSV